jgi:hypothetical protein
MGSAACGDAVYVRGFQETGRDNGKGTAGVQKEAVAAPARFFNLPDIVPVGAAVFRDERSVYIKKYRAGQGSGVRFVSPVFFTCRTN